MSIIFGLSQVQVYHKFIDTVSKIWLAEERPPVVASATEPNRTRRVLEIQSKARVLHR
jgi:hypothetical protein